MTPAPFPLTPDPLAPIQLAYRAALTLSTSQGNSRSQAVLAMAKALKDHQNELLEANTLDLETSREMAVPDILLDWLKLTPERIQNTVQLLQRLSELPDPIGQVMTANFQVDHCQTYSQRTPLGVIALIYESLPQLGAIAAGLCIKTGNSIILKGSSEASHSNAVIAQALTTAIEDSGLPAGSLVSLPTDQGMSVRDLVLHDRYLNLVIPYGRPSLVQQVLRQSTAPVLKSAIGNCYLYWSPAGSLEAVRRMILDSHISEPDAVNAIEKVLIHPQQNRTSLTMLWSSLQEKGFEIRGDEILAAEFSDLIPAAQTEWQQAYLDRIVSFKVVDDLASAITWINQSSSGHADSLVTDSYQESRQFALGVQSASTYINASPRFYRNPKHGDSIFLGMSNQKGHRRGPVSLETLTTTKHIIQGMGQF
jgi:glutamate-5-semialdehyde dehydrogenase